MSDTPDARENRKLQIWQQNINQSLEGQLDEHEPTHTGWLYIYPKQHLLNPNKTRSVMLINRNISTNNWDEINIISSDVTGVRLHGEFRTIDICNVYNDCTNNDSLKVVEGYMRKRGDGNRARNREGGKRGDLVRGFQQAPSNMGRSKKHTFIHKGGSGSSTTTAQYDQQLRHAYGISKGYTDARGMCDEESHKS